MPKKVIIILLFICAWLGWKFMMNQKSNLLMSDHQIVTAQLANQTFHFEAVTTPPSIAQGLSDRKEIGSDGMLFILATTRIPTFWMKNMLFDLDMVWIANGKVVDITRQVAKPSPGMTESELPLISPSQPVNMVLEIPSGQADAWQIEIGQSIIFP